MLHTLLLASFTEIMQLLLGLPEDIGNKIYHMWHDIKDYSENEAAEIFEYQHQVDNDRYSEGWWDEFI